MRFVVSKLFKNNSIVGKCEMTFQTSFASLNNIYINERHRSNGYGSRLLSYTEQFMYFNYAIQKIDVLAWEKQLGYTSSFYKKNGYSRIPFRHTTIYDDGEHIYELIPFSKRLYSVPEMLCNDSDERSSQRITVSVFHSFSK